MICTKCGKEADKSAKFCPECGGELSETEIKTISLRCKACGGVLSSEKDNPVLFCPYCGSKELITESDNVTIERIKSDTQKQLERERLEHEKEMDRRQSEARQLERREEKQREFKKGKLSKVLIVFFIISLLVTALNFANGRILPAFMSMLQAGIFAVAWLFGMQIIEEKFSGLHIIATVAGILMIIPFIWSSTLPSYKDYTWPESGICQMLPKPDSNVGLIVSDSDSSFCLRVDKTSRKQYDNYLNKCIEAGFTVEPEKSSADYKAFNADGYKLDLFYTESTKQMTVSLDAPMKMSEYKWPVSSAAKQLPQPASKFGSIETDNSEKFVIYVNNTPIDKYEQYVESCQKSGFTVDYVKGDDYFKADNPSGYHVDVRYEGNSTMRIQIDAPKKPAATTTKAATTTAAPETSESAEAVAITEATSADVSETVEETTAEPASSIADDMIRPEVKQAIDAYESFMNDYIAFMQKYKEGGSSFEMLADYLNYMQKFAEETEKIDALDEAGEMTKAESLYYLEVTMRVEQNLLKAMM